MTDIKQADAMMRMARRARYEEGHLATDVPLAREEILKRIDDLLQQVDQSIKALR